MKGGDTAGCFPTGRHYPGIAHRIKVRAVGAANEFDADARWVDLPIAFIDTETTGIDARTGRIIEVGIVIGKAGEIVGRHSWLLNPGMPIPQESTAIHGIEDKDVADKKPFKDLVSAMVDKCCGAIPAAYNAEFDKGFIMAEIERAGWGCADPPPAIRRDVTWIDPLVFARELFKGKGESRALGAVAERYGIPIANAHRATDDAEAALRVLYKMSKDPRLPETYGAMLQEQRRLDRLQAEARRFWRK